MKVNIERTTRERGVFNKTIDHVVMVKVIFTEEELHLIHRNAIDETVIAKRPPRVGEKPGNDPEKWYLRLGHLLKGETDFYEFEHERLANEYQDQIIPGLRAVKQWLETEGQPRERSVTVEI